MDETVGYACPTHPGVRRLGPGLCPKCGAGLVERATQAESARSVAARVLILGALVVVGLTLAATAAALLR